MGIGSFLKRLLAPKKQEIFKVHRKPGPDLEDVPRWDDKSVSEGKGQNIQSVLSDYMDLYATQPYVYVCARDIAQAAASVKYQILKEGTELTDPNSVIASTLKSPNPHETWKDLIEVTFLHLELSGNAFWELVRDEKGELIGIYSLHPHKMEIVPHPSKKVSGYVYYPKKGSTEEIVYSADEILHFKYIDPKDQYWGQPPIRASGNSITLDFYALGWNKDFFKNGAVPDGVLESEEQISETAYNRMIALWIKRHGNLNKKSHMPAILEEGLKYKPIGISQRDMQFKDLRAMSKQEVYDVMGVPATWRTNPAEKKSFWLDNVIPKLGKIEQAINIHLMQPDENSKNMDNFEFKFVSLEIESIVEDEAVKTQIVGDLVAKGIMTINEVRARYWGKPPVPWGEEAWMPVGLAPVSSGLHPTTPTAPNGPGNQITTPYRAGESSPYQVPNVQQPSRLDSAAPAKKSVGGWVPLDKIDLAEPDWRNRKAVYMWKAWIAWAKAAAGDEKKLAQLIGDYFEEQFIRLKRKIRPRWNKHVKKGADLTIKKEENVDDLLFDLDEEGSILRSVFGPEVRRIIEKYGNQQLGEFKIDIDFDMQDPRIVKFMNEHTGENITHIEETTRDMVRRRLAESVQKGEDFDDAMVRLGEIFAPEGGIAEARARLIARTELVTLTNQAKYEAAKQTGVVKRKMWVSELLPTTRREENGPNHADMNGRILPIDKKFSVRSRSGTDEMDGPGDGSASAENVCGCLCVLDFPPETEEFADLFEEDQGDSTQKRVEKTEGGVTIQLPPVNIPSVVVNMPAQQPLKVDYEKIKPERVIKTVIRDASGNVVGVEERPIYKDVTNNRD